MADSSPYTGEPLGVPTGEMKFGIKAVSYTHLAGTVSVSCLLGEDNQCFIPWECLTRAGEYLRVGVYGTRGEEMVLPTVSCLLGPICTGTPVSYTHLDQW